MLKSSKWRINLDIIVAMRDMTECVVALSDSQALRFIDEINGVTDRDSRAAKLKERIKEIKRQDQTPDNRRLLRSLYNELYNVQYVSDYVCIIMDSNKDYDYLNDNGFVLNGIKYRRFLGTNGGIKKSTIVYINAAIYDEMKYRLDNGRNMNHQLVPAKLEAYQALICSGSTPIPKPDGIIVVPDCITKFTDDVITIDDSLPGEPVLKHVNGYEVEHNDSDGYGLMLPQYSRRVNGCLNGDYNNTLSGINTRYAWNKGMIYTFDYIEFAKVFNGGSYMVTDVWGDQRDVRKSEVILTASMLKLWDAYESWEDYYKNCEKNHYEFSTTKTTPEQLENTRTTNYQFLQSYHLTDSELKELCQPTISEIQEVLGLDYRKSLAFLCGSGLNDRNVFLEDTEKFVKALLVEKDMINDPFIRRKIWGMIGQRIEAAKRGCIRVNGNYAMILGDPFALAQSMYGLPVTGLLKAGEVYHKYWIDHGANEIVCFRAPMTCHNNIRKMKLNNSEECSYWYQYITSALAFNAWDTACDAMNGADKDGDTNMCTNNPVLLSNTKNSPTIMCQQRKAKKIVPTETDIIIANKLAFNDDIGTVTNRVTSMIERQAAFDKDSKEYKVLDYRIMCGQSYQQATIDRAKGIIAESMPPSWYSYRDCQPKDGDSAVVLEEKEFNRRIVAENKPYFMIYVYPNLRKKYNKFKKNSDTGIRRKFYHDGISSIDELRRRPNCTEEMRQCLSYYDRFIPVGMNSCLVNRICWLVEDSLDYYITKPEVQSQFDFDYTIMKRGVEYSKQAYAAIEKLYKEYIDRCGRFGQKLKDERVDEYDSSMEKRILIDYFKMQCAAVCSNEYELCDIVLDICYQTEKSKQFAWDICGDTIVENLLNRHSREIYYPLRVETSGEFEYCGDQYILKQKRV